MAMAANHGGGDSGSKILWQGQQQNVVAMATSTATAVKHGGGDGNGSNPWWRRQWQQNLVATDVVDQA